MTFAEADVERAALERLEGLGWQSALHVPNIAPVTMAVLVSGEVG